MLRGPHQAPSPWSTMSKSQPDPIMNQTEINAAIENALNNLYNLNQSLCDYWISELYDDNEDGEINFTMWTEETLKEIETDVMNNSTLLAD